VTEPRRWIETDEVSRELASLLPAGKADLELPDAVRARVAMHVHCLAAASLTAGIVPAATGSAAVTGTQLGSAAGGATTAVSASFKALALKAVLGASICTSLATAVVLHPPASWLQTQKAQTSAKIGGPLPLKPVADDVLPAGEEHADQPSPAVAVPLNAAQVSVEPSQLAASSGRRRVVSKGDPLAQEIQQLRRAKDLLNSDPAQALRLIQAHASAFPTSGVQVERQVLKLRALLAVGERQQAERLGAQLLADDAARLYHAQVRRRLGLSVSAITVK
jgi:hypothetical protein